MTKALLRRLDRYAALDHQRRPPVTEKSPGDVRQTEPAGHGLNQSAHDLFVSSLEGDYQWTLATYFLAAALPPADIPVGNLSWFQPDVRPIRRSQNQKDESGSSTHALALAKEMKYYDAESVCSENPLWLAFFTPLRIRPGTQSSGGSRTSPMPTFLSSKELELFFTKHNNQKQYSSAMFRFPLSP